MGSLRDAVAERAREVHDALLGPLTGTMLEVIEQWIEKRVPMPAAVPAFSYEPDPCEPEPEDSAVRTELELHKTADELPGPERRVLFYAVKPPVGYAALPIYSSGHWHAGELRTRVFSYKELPEDTMVFRSDASDNCGENEEYLPDAVRVWAYPPEVKP